MERLNLPALHLAESLGYEVTRKNMGGKEATVIPLPNGRILAHDLTQLLKEVPETDPVAFVPQALVIWEQPEMCLREKTDNGLWTCQGEVCSDCDHAAVHRLQGLICVAEGSARQPLKSLKQRRYDAPL